MEAKEKKARQRHKSNYRGFVGILQGTSESRMIVSWNIVFENSDCGAFGRFCHRLRLTGPCEEPGGNGERGSASKSA